MTNVITRFAISRRGNVAIIAGLTLPMLVGFAGLGSETAYWYFRQRDLQGAVDVAAYNGALALRTGATATVITAKATTDSVTGGWRAADGTITVHTPPTTGTHQINRAVEVILTETEQRYFSGMFTGTPVQIRTRAVASYADLGNACVLALDKTKTDAMQFWGSSISTFTNCNAYSDSISPTGFSVGGSAAASMSCASSAGGFNVDAGLTLTGCAKKIDHAAQVPDPYASLATPAIPSGCENDKKASLTPGKYCGGMTLNGAATLAPGVYVIDGGPLKINAGADLTGAGVTFYLRNGATVQMNGNSHFNISAPITGTYKGVLMYGDRTQAYDVNKINGNNTSSMTGALYFASQKVEFQGSFSGVNGCMQIVANTIEYTGNSNFSADCTAYGLNNIKTPGGVTLVE